MNAPIAKSLITYIDAETSDATLYRELANMAPSEDAREILMDFADDEQSHADEFIMLYRSITGRKYTPEVKPVQLVGSYRDILLDRVIDESGDFRKYGDEYLQASKNKALQDAFYRARTDENVHALRLLYLLNQLR